MTSLPRPKQALPDSSQPWVGEPDRRMWKTKVGLLALVARHDLFGHLCGYVELPEGQTAFPASESYFEFDLECHGGLTFHGKLRAELGGTEGADWLGFDCNHYWDIAPKPSEPFGNLLKRPGAQYRTFAYCEEQCESLARQIALAILAKEEDEA